jgi:hypothetical protein
MKIKDFVHNFIEKLQKPKKSFLLILFFPFLKERVIQRLNPGLEMH